MPRIQVPSYIAPAPAVDHPDSQALTKWVVEAFQAQGRALQEFENVRLTVASSEPARPREGTIAFADGANWDPGDGKGAYVYTDGAWERVGGATGLPFVYAGDYGVVADGVADDTTGLQDAIDATPAGGTLLLPQGLCKVVGSGTQCLLVQQPINIVGVGWASGIFPDSSVPNTRDILAVIPTGTSRGYSFRDFGIRSFGQGRHGLMFDGGSHSVQYGIHVQRMLFDATPGGNSIYGQGATSGVFAYSSIKDCLIGGSIKIVTCGDGLTIADNFIGDDDRIGLQIEQVAGGAGLNIRRNVVTNKNGMLELGRAVLPVIEGNEFEQPSNSSNAHATMADIGVNASAYCINPRIINNSFSRIPGTTGISSLIRTGYCVNPVIDGNRLSIGVAGTNHILLEVNTNSAVIGANNYYYNESFAEVGGSISDLSARARQEFSEHFLTLTADQNGANSATAQTWFPGGGPTTITVMDNSTYSFEGLLAFARTAGTTSHSIFNLFGGTAVVSSIGYILTGVQTTSGFFGASSGQTALIQTAGIAAVFGATSSANEHVVMRVQGTVRFTTGGTFTPQFKYDAAPGGTPSVQANTFFRMRQIGSNTVVGLGFN